MLTCHGNESDAPNLRISMPSLPEPFILGNSTVGDLVPARLYLPRFWNGYGRSMHRQIRKKRIITGPLELPQPGKGGRLLELPDGGRVA
jgi:hypothetical protein